jgi:hypothetical protein
MNLIKLLTTIPAILIGYVSIRSCQFVYSLFYYSESLKMVAAHILSLLSGFVLAYLTFRRNIIACWAMVIFLILSGVSIFFFGIVVLPISQYLFKFINIVIGIYFSYGAVVLFRSIRKGEMKDKIHQ